MRFGRALIEIETLAEDLCQSCPKGHMNGIIMVIKISIMGGDRQGSKA